MTTPSTPVQTVRAPRHVRLVSGKIAQVQTATEAEWFEATRDAYLEQLRFTEKTDLIDLDRLLIHELMIFRWTQFSMSGIDYDGDMVDEKRVSTDIKAYCVDENTEVLTDAGWRLYHEVVPGQAIYTLDTDSGFAEWQVPSTFNVGRGHKMLHLQSRNHSSLTTPEHSWPVWQGGAKAKRAEWRTSETLNTASWVMTAADPAPREAVEVDAFVELVGWYWTEGCLVERRGRPSQASVVQSGRVNPEYCERIRVALAALYGAPGPLGSVRGQRRAPHWAESRRGDMVIFRLSVQVAEDLQRACPGREKVLDPAWLRSLTRDQLRRLIDASVCADGWVTSRGAVRICQAHEGRVRAFEMACALAGVPTTTKRRSVGDWEVGLLASRRVAPVNAAAQRKTATAEYVDYEGTFWCPTVANGTWLARREGTVWWSGNSDQINKIKESMGLNKKARDAAANDGDFSQWIADLKMRAKVFGVHRETQLTKALVLMNELSSIVGVFDRSDAEERQRVGFESAAEVLKWIRETMLPEYHAIDQYFMEHEQRYWVRDL